MQSEIINSRIPIGQLEQHFRNLNKSDVDDLPSFSPDNLPQNATNVELNNNITEDEVNKQIKKLKNNKTPGSDQIINEFIKFSSPALVQVITKLFNLLLLYYHLVKFLRAGRKGLISLSIKGRGHKRTLAITVVLLFLARLGNYSPLF